MHRMGRVGERVYRRWQLRAVGMAVKDGESPDYHGRDPQRGLCGEGDQQPKHNGRSRDANLYEGQRHADHPNCGCERHDEGEDDRQDPQIAGRPRKAPQRPTATMAAT